MSKIGYLTIFILLFCSNLLLAQVPAWGGGADETDLAFGFSFGYVNNTFKIVKKPDWRSPYFDTGTNRYITDSLKSISSSGSPGFAIGFITRYSLDPHLEVRTTPTLVFADRSIYYIYDTPSQNVTKQVQTTLVDFPVSLKLKSDRHGDYRAYILGGVKYDFAIGKGAVPPDNDPLSKLVKNTQGYGSYEAGLGCDIYFEFFKLSPEIKISNTFGNILVQDSSPFSTPLSKLSLHTITFSLIFE